MDLPVKTRTALEKSDMVTPIWKILLAAVIEVSYAMFTRTWLRHHAGGIQWELWTSAARVVSLIAYCLLFRELLLSRQPRYGALANPVLGVSIGVILLIPVLFGAWGLPGRLTQTVFAITSLIVGIREEVFYRGVLQNLFEKWFSWREALLFSNLIFLLLHYGAVAFTFYNLVSIFTMGVILGLIYIRTGSLWPGIILHTIYDALWTFTPLISHPLDSNWRIPFHLASLALAVIWFQKSNVPGPKRRSRGLPRRSFRAKAGHETHLFSKRATPPCFDRTAP